MEKPTTATGISFHVEGGSAPTRRSVRAAKMQRTLVALLTDGRFELIDIQPDSALGRKVLDRRAFETLAKDDVVEVRVSQPRPVIAKHVTKGAAR